jgi:branched-chain amino acid transport system ATP-binding protein
VLDRGHQSLALRAQAGALAAEAVEVARALAADPVLIVLDEPAAGLRRAEKDALARQLRALRGDGVTILIVEHDMEFVMGLADRVIVMDFGAKLMEGLPSAGARQPHRPGSLPWRGRMTPILEVADLHVCYGKVEAVRGASLVMGKGQIVTIIGPNGAGKTTLLAAIMGLRAAAGRVTFGGCDLARLEVEDRVAMGMSLVPERRELFGEMTVADNLMLGAYARGRDRAALRRRCEAVYARFPPLAERRRQPAHTLSGGERQMLALGRALMGRPRLLLLDEPSLGLAPLIVRDIFRIIASLRELGVAILLVEQNARAALETADHGYVLENGEIVLAGPAAALMHDSRIVASYLGGSA